MGQQINTNQYEPPVEEDWIAPTLLNSWANYGSSYAEAGYYKDSLGRVHLKGLLNGGSPGSSSVIFTLPAGYRPSERLIFSTISSGTTECELRIYDNGNVIAYSGTAWYTIDGISFRAEQ